MALRVQQRRGVLELVLGFLSWIHSVTVRPIVNFWSYSILGAAEEAIRSLIRESLALTQRSINGVSAWFLSVSNRNYKRQLRGRWQELADLHSWWREEKKHSSLNAVLARNYGDSADGGPQTDRAPAAAEPHRTDLGDNVAKRYTVQPSNQQISAAAATDKLAGERVQSQTRSSAAVTPSNANITEIEPADENEQLQLQEHSQEQQQSDSEGVDSDEQESAQWWQQGPALLPTAAPAWLTAVSEEAQEAAAAAQEAASAATAAVQQAATTVSYAAQQAMEEAAAAAAALARNMRTVFEQQQPAGWTVHEAIKGRTGLLEDLSLFSQLMVTRIFDAIRWVVSLITFTPTAATSTRTPAAASGAPPRLAGLRHAVAAGTASPRASRSGRTSKSGFSSSRLGASDEKRTQATQATATACSEHRSKAGIAWRPLSWPWQGWPSNAQLSAGAPTTAAAKWAAAGEEPRGSSGISSGVVQSPAASPGFRRRSVSSVDLPTATRMWASESDDEETSSVDSNTHAEVSSAAPAAEFLLPPAALASTATPAAVGRTSLSPSKQPLKPALSAGSAAQRSDSGFSSVPAGLRHSWTGGQQGPNKAAAVVTGSGYRVAFAGAPEAGRVGALGPAQGGAGGAGQCGDDGHTPSNVAKSPFSSTYVQEKHHSVISKEQMAQLQDTEVEDGVRSYPRDKFSLQDKRQLRQRHKQLHSNLAKESSSRASGRMSGDSGSVGSAGSGTRPLHRSHSGPAMSELKDISSAGQVIRMAGYPLEVHEVQTTDGYLLRMERIPQHSATDVVFMMHGVLDTSLTWVAGGITGSQAFAAWDRGFDVWLGSTRSNPPHAAADPRRQGSAYWRYTHNEVGMYDMGAQIDHIHTTKLLELAALGIAASNIGCNAVNVGQQTGMPSSPRPHPAAQTVKATTAAGQPGQPQGGSCSSPRTPLASAIQTPRVSMTRTPPGTPHATAAAAEPALAVDTARGVAAADACIGTADSQAVAAAESMAAELLTADQQEALDLFPASAETALPPSPRVHAASYGPATALQLAGVNGSWGSGSLHRAESAAESDAAAAAEAAHALQKYRAAAAAAGIAQPCESAGTAADMTRATSIHSSPAGHAAATGQVADLFWWQRGARTRSLQPGRRAGSLDLSPRAATAATAAAAAAGAGTAAVFGGGIGAAGAAAAVAAAAATAAVSALSSEQEQHDVTESPISSVGSSAAVACTVHIKHDDRHDARAESPDNAAVSQFFFKDVHAQQPATGTAEPAMVSRAFGSAISLRHVSSAPDMASMGQKLAGSAPLCSGCNADGTDQIVGAAISGTSILPKLEHGMPLSTAVAGTAAHQQEAPLQLRQLHPLQDASQHQQPLTPRRMQPSQQHQELEVTTPRSGHALSHAGSSGISAAEPYNLRVVSHSLGGLLMLIYCIQRNREGRPHHVKRLILLSPAGYHLIIPRMFVAVVYVWGLFMWYMTWVWRQQAFPVHLPTFMVRMLTFKLTIDSSKLPAVGDLVRALARLFLGGDRSAWDRALMMPHYAAAGMPLLSSFQVMHFIQLYTSKRCQLYDYGSAAANVAAYHQPTPPVLSDCYHTLRGVPVHLLGGLHDGVIPRSNVQCHYTAMKEAGVDVSYREFDYGHMDFTFSAKEELGYYVSSLLMRK